MSYFDNSDFSNIDDNDASLDEYWKNKEKLIDKNRKYCHSCLSSNCVKCTGCQCDCKSDNQ